MRRRLNHEDKPAYIRDWEEEHARRDVEPLPGQLSLIPDQVPEVKKRPEQGRLFE